MSTYKLGNFTLPKSTLGAETLIPAGIGAAGGGIAIANPVAGALIIAGSSLISGIMGGLTAEKKRKQELLMQANQQEFEGKMKSAETMAKGTQSAFDQMMDAYKRSLT